MTTGYTRQSTANIQPNLEINAEDLNAEFDALEDTFDNTAGHDHSGSTTGTGAQISMTDSVTGTLTVPNGGTGLATITAHSLMVGNGITELTVLPTGSANQLLQSLGTGLDPVWVSTISLTSVAASGFVSGATVTSSGAITAVGAVSGGTLSTAGNIVALGTITGGNIATGGTINANGNINGASLTVSAPVAVLQGGTGATTAANAFANIVRTASSIVANGYILLANGLLLQWGSTAIVGANTIGVIFPLNFPNAVFTVQTSTTLTAGSALSSGISSLSVTGFNFNLDAVATCTGYWFAVGN